MTDQSKSLKVQNGQEMAEQGEHTRERSLFVPRTDINETDEEIVVLVDLPGVDAKNVDISLERNVLTIDASPLDEQMEGYSLVYCEYATGDYQRRFVLSDTIDKEKISAEVKDGVLHLRLPKAGPAKARKISVN